ncbi:polysaccharide biosynthesis/export family protein [Rhizobium sp. TRM96647]|uniref:polysaccharide biosynthesis/export family protein n=1 Tax=unclassified Rhizobium TaxID=2613769 RepID=UPI0021E8D8BF|nr:MULTISPECIES: polysaccharide biosynthesis/export family protein [unclassified Rhizobium]MCV3736262.1 polysaccharide biosynthesis/export family protein [Rhizobium sp. TRM96647]MCV3758631.1 polysaccharide biosynthesis/export family protein [Rhizobium sp. TRM96650]
MPVAILQSCRSLKAGIILSALVVAGALAPAPAVASKLAPQTRIRLSVVQWMPTRGTYERWDALGGEFVVSDEGTLSLPVLGNVPVGDLDEAQLAARIAEQLKTRIGLVEKPDASIAVIDYPPVYVVGDVASPGEYRFRPGLTVLQTLAMAGGEFRLEGLTGTRGVEYAGELRELNDSILRGSIRVARLEAEMAGAKGFDFDLKPYRDNPLAATIFQQEQQIFAARAAVVERQSRSFTELRELMGQEIDTLEKKIDSNDEDIESVRKELETVKPMVERGVILPTRQTDLERSLRGYQATRLDMVTAIMRARQNISEATRNLEGLTDNRQVDVTAQLQAEKGALKQLQLRRDTRNNVLNGALGGNADGDSAASTSLTSYSISRRAGGKVDMLEANETTTVQPGDVVRVVRTRLPTAGTLPDEAADVPAADDPTEQASQ